MEQLEKQLSGSLQDSQNWLDSRGESYSRWTDPVFKYFIPASMAPYIWLTFSFKAELDSSSVIEYGEYMLLNRCP